ncbi:hypothetical protein Tco_1526725, partial [Tanacetum coccineum]
SIEFGEGIDGHDAVKRDIVLSTGGIDGHDAVKRDIEASLSKLLPPSICESPTIGFKKRDSLLNIYNHWANCIEAAELLQMFSQGILI